MHQVPAQPQTKLGVIVCKVTLWVFDGQLPFSLLRDFLTFS